MRAYSGSKSTWLNHGAVDLDLSADESCFRGHNDGVASVSRESSLAMADWSTGRGRQESSGGHGCGRQRAVREMMARVKENCSEECGVGWEW